MRRVPAQYTKARKRKHGENPKIVFDAFILKRLVVDVLGSFHLLFR